MTTALSIVDWIAIILVFIGALNWGSIGVFDYNFIVALFGLMTTITRVIYILVGLAGIYLIFAASSWVRHRPE